MTSPTETAGTANSVSTFVPLDVLVSSSVISLGYYSNYDAEFSMDVCVCVRGVI